MPTYFDRYSFFRTNGEVKPVPGIVIQNASSDKFITYEVGKTRMDILSQEYYTNPYHGWLIMRANPQFGGLEFNIPDGSLLRVPFPLDSGLQRYTTAVETHKKLYG